MSNSKYSACCYVVIEFPCETTCFLEQGQFAGFTSFYNRNCGEKLFLFNRAHVYLPQCYRYMWTLSCIFVWWYIYILYIISWSNPKNSVQFATLSHPQRCLNYPPNLFPVILSTDETTGKLQSNPSHVGTDPRLTEVGQIGIDNQLLEPTGGIQTRTTENVTRSRSIVNITGGLGGGMFRGYAIFGARYTHVYKMGTYRVTTPLTGVISPLFQYL